MADKHFDHPSEEAIKLRSYLIWEREGRPEGADLEHWRRAQEELAAELHAAPPLRKASAVVAPRLPISTRPCKSVATRINLKRSAVAAEASARKVETGLQLADAKK